MYMEDLSLNGKSYLKYSQATKDLSNGKIDCIIVDEVIAKEIIKNQTGFKILEEVLQTDKFAVAVKKGNKELLDKINPIIKKLKEDGKIDEFMLAHTQG